MKFNKLFLKIWMVKRDFFFFFFSFFLVFHYTIHDIEVHASVIKVMLWIWISLSLTSDKLTIFTIPFLVTLDDFWLRRRDCFLEERESILNKISINHGLLLSCTQKKKKKYSLKPINLRISKADPITEKHRHVHKSRVTDSNYHIIIPLELILVTNPAKYRKFKRQTV